VSEECSEAEENADKGKRDEETGQKQAAETDQKQLSVQSQERVSFQLIFWEFI